MMDTTTSSNNIPYDDKELIAFENTDDVINMLFMLHESILLKDAKGTTHKVTNLGSHILDKVLLHKVRNENGHEFLVDGNLYPLWILLMSVLFLYQLSNMRQNFQN
jgi:hypothetical protein